jgi:hypothetical protein
MVPGGGREAASDVAPTGPRRPEGTLDPCPAPGPDAALDPRPVVDPDVPLDAELLVDIAQGLAAATGLIEAVVNHDPLVRRPVRLLATPRYEAWVIGWTEGQRVEPHDHGPSLGVVAVTEGTLTELHPCDGRLVSRELPAGNVHVVPVGAIHDITNLTGRPATSVHVYSPPLITMTRYDADTLAPIVTDVIEPEPSALPAAVASVLLHPAQHA